MKGVLFGGALVLALLGAGLAWALRRQPGSADLLETAGDGFTSLPSGSGRLLKLQDALFPLRVLRWLPPMPGGFLAAQMLGQNDRQRVALFRDGTPTDTLLVVKPAGVAEAFWRFAELRDAAMAPGGLLILLYRAGDPASQELPLVLALDLASQQARWSFRGAGARLAMAEGQEPGVYLFGGANPVQRLSLAAAGPGRPAAREVVLPPGLSEVEDLLPTGAWSFLASHRDGLAAYRPGAGWTQQPSPADRGQACLDWRSSLTRAGKDIWWQAAPGHLTRVRPDGRPGPDWKAALPAADPFALDARLWRVLGADPKGGIWLALATPVVAQAAPAPAASAADSAGTVPASPAADPASEAAAAPAAGAPPAAGPEAPAPADAQPDWASYLAQGLDRIYRWDPAGGTLERVSLQKAWAALNPPPTVQPPQPSGLTPAAGAILAEGVRCAWWLPLDALPLARPDQAM